MSEFTNEDLVELETGQNLLVRPSSQEIKDIADGNYFGYVRPAYQHYNWCLNYLGIDKPFITWETRLIKLSQEDYRDIGEIMVAACKKYLQENSIEN